MQNRLVDGFDGPGRQRRLGRSGYSPQNLLFTARGAGGRMELLLDQPHFAHHLRPLVEQHHNLIVNRIDALA